MRNQSSFVCALILALCPVVFVQACHSRDDGAAPRETTPGPAERAGQKVDEAAHDATETADEAAAKTKESAEDAARWTRDKARSAASAVGSTTERAGEKMQGK